MKFFQLSIFENLFEKGNRMTRRRRVRNRRPARRSPRLIESDPLLYSRWRNIAAEYFPGRDDLLNYSVFWSNRPQKRTLASCHVRKLRVAVARELNFPEHERWLDPLLYHEMCHAALGLSIQRANGKRQWHGAEFRRLEKRHPGIAALDQWIKSGGWRSAVRSERSKSAHRRRVLARVQNG